MNTYNHGNTPLRGQPHPYNLRRQAAGYNLQGDVRSSTPHGQLNGSSLVSIQGRPEVSAIVSAPMPTPMRPREAVHRTFTADPSPLATQPSIFTNSEALAISTQPGSLVWDEYALGVCNLMRNELDRETAEGSGRANLPFSPLENNQSPVGQSSTSHANLIRSDVVSDNTISEAQHISNRTSHNQSIGRPLLHARGREENCIYIPTNQGQASQPSQSEMVHPTSIDCSRKLVRQAQTGDFPPIRSPPTFRDIPSGFQADRIALQSPIQHLFMPEAISVPTESLNSVVQDSIARDKGRKEFIDRTKRKANESLALLEGLQLQGIRESDVNVRQTSPVVRPYSKNTSVASMPADISMFNPDIPPPQFCKPPLVRETSFGASHPRDHIPLGFNPITGQGYSPPFENCVGERRVPVAGAIPRLSASAVTTSLPITAVSTTAPIPFFTASNTSIPLFTTSTYVPPVFTAVTSVPRLSTASTSVTHSAFSTTAGITPASIDRQTLTSQPTAQVAAQTFDWQRMESLFLGVTQAIEGALVRSQTGLPSADSCTFTSTHTRSSVTFTEPIVSHSRSPPHAKGRVGQTRTVSESDSASDSVLHTVTGSGSDLSEYTSSDSFQNRSRRYHGRKSMHKDRFRSLHSSVADVILTDQDITVLTRQGVSKNVLRQRQLQQSLDTTRVEDLPDIPATQFVVNMSAESVPVFSGRMEDYESFKEIFLAYAQALPVTQRLAILKTKLDKNSVNTIASCIGRDKASFEHAFHLLDQKNNKKDLLINILISKIDAYFEFQYEDDDKFTDMVSGIQAIYNRILSIDPLQLTTLNGLTSRFSKCLPDKPYGRVSNLMGKIRDGVSRYNFRNVLKICERHVDWLSNQSANHRAGGRRRNSSQHRHQSNLDRSPRGNFNKEHGYKPRFAAKKGQAVYSASETDWADESHQEDELEQELVAQASMTESNKPNVSSASKILKPIKDGRSRERSVQRVPTGQGSVVSGVSTRQRERSRSRSRSRRNACTLCSSDGHIPRDCPDPPSKLLEFVDSSRLCRICLLRGHYAHECPILLYCPTDGVVCRDSDCDKRPHAVSLCSELKKK